MQASSTKGTKVCVLKGASTGNSLTPTAISSAAPAVVTVASTAGMAKGDLVKIPDTGKPGATGFPELDGKIWAIDIPKGAAPNTFTLVGSDTTGTTGTLAGSPAIDHYGTSDFLCICLSEINFNPENSKSINVATFCDPTATIPSQVVGAGTVEIAGYVDITDPGYKELIAAEADGKSREWRVTLGNDQGYVLFSGILATLSLTLPIDGASGFAGTISLGSKYRHLF